MSLREISLPSGGRAWLSTKHRRYVEWLRYQLAHGESTDKVDGIFGPIEEAIRIFVHHWEVRDPDTDEALHFPDDIAEMDEGDQKRLFAEIVRIANDLAALPKLPGESPMSSSDTAESTSET